MKEKVLTMEKELIIENIQDRVEFTDELSLLIEKAIEESLKLEGFEKPSEISVLIVDDERIRGINKEQRNIDKATDVLSFPMLDMENGELLCEDWDYDPEGNYILLGDIVLSLETAKRQAEEYGHSLEREVAFLTTHSMLHLLGYDHMEEDEEKTMIEKQEMVLTKMGLRR